MKMLSDGMVEGKEKSRMLTVYVPLWRFSMSGIRRLVN